MSSKEQFFPNTSYIKNNFTDNLVASHDEIKFTNANNTNTSNFHEFSSKKKQYQAETTNNIYINTNTKTNDTASASAENFIETIVRQINITHPLEGNKYNHWRDESQKINSDYKYELGLLQNKYSDILRETAIRFFPVKSVDHIIYKNSNSMVSKEEIKEIDPAEDLIKRISNKTIFSDIKLLFVPSKTESFENGIKRLRQIYEEKTEDLEKQMDENKNVLESHYRKRIQNAKNFQLNSIDFPNSNLSIMNITTEHNEKLKLLREVYQEKMKSLEQNFFDILKSITTNFGKAN